MQLATVNAEIEESKKTFVKLETTEINTFLESSAHSKTPGPANRNS